MKLILGSLTLLVFFSIVSCTKTNNVTTTIRDTTVVIQKDTVYVKSHLNPIVGLWIGKYLNSGDVDSFYYSFDIQPNGNCIATAIGSTNNSIATSGPWNLNGTGFSATLTQLTLSPTPAIQAVTATYDSTAGSLTGQWTYTQGAGIAGTFKLTRVP
ncbi:MAG TPA: hypothetical protein VHD83_28025 [Puia sp.]|nr:hypothetical protein [Puia sp.]